MPMTMFDYAVLAILALAAALAFWRGLIREAVALASWFIAFWLALVWAPPVERLLSGVVENATVRIVISYAGVFLGALIAGGLIGLAISKLAHFSGLGPIDRALGALFGMLKGSVLVLALVLLAGFTPLPKAPWWRDSVLAPPFTAVVLALRPWLPADLAAMLDYGPPAVQPDAGGKLTPPALGKV